MPYLPDHTKRRAIKHAVQDMQIGTMDEAELNFTFCCILNDYVDGEMRYARINQATGAVLLSFLEWHHHVVRPYEDIKIEQNGNLDWAFAWPS